MTRARSRATSKSKSTATIKQNPKTTSKATAGPVIPKAPIVETVPPPVVPVTKAGRVRPLELVAPYLGKRPDEWFAERIGRSIQTVAAMRLAAGMPSYGERCRARLPITNSDEEIERAIAAFRAARKKYPHRGPTPGGF